MPTPADPIDQITDSLIKACTDMTVMVRDTMNASLQSATILTKGYEEMCDSVNSILQKSLENNAQVSRAMMSAKSVQDMMDTHSNLLKSGFDNVMVEMNRILQLSSRLAQDAAEPVTQNVNAAINKISQTKVA